MVPSFHATTICAVMHNGQAAIAGDGQVTFGESVIMKTTAKKVRRLYRGQVIAGFAGFTIFLQSPARQADDDGEDLFDGNE